MSIFPTFSVLAVNPVNADMVTDMIAASDWASVAGNADVTVLVITNGYREIKAARDMAQPYDVVLLLEDGQRALRAADAAAVVNCPIVVVEDYEVRALNRLDDADLFSVKRDLPNELVEKLLKNSSSFVRKGR